MKVSGAPASSTVTIELKQIQGRAPFWIGSPQTVPTDTTGSAFATFTVTLQGPTPSATLQATAVGPGATYEPDAHSVEVLP